MQCLLLLPIIEHNLFVFFSRRFFPNLLTTQCSCSRLSDKKLQSGHLKKRNQSRYLKVKYSMPRHKLFEALLLFKHLKIDLNSLFL